MNKKIFNEIVKVRKIKPNTIKNSIWAFLCGGIIGLFGQVLLLFFNNTLDLPLDESKTYMYFVIIFITNILTSLGVFDMFSTYAGAGAFIPISGFANALTSCAIEGRSEGLIFGIGSNMFKLAGSVIVYGISSAIIYSIFYYFLSLIGG
ncbi:MAG: SpoVA/SpoVAEb family sporulation membrane protein [Bacilli bacterium]|nr:SpoVA/SpoVAEb family sporulation membrane protein [Bacilli bacterium]